MPRLETLNELSRLQESGFGQPHPRHGLNLLYWFAKKYIYIDDNEMICRCDPEKRVYGFHPFENRYDGNVQLLPDTDLYYYEVGNLGKPRAHELPRYVKRYYTGDHDDSNTDRIIISVDDDDHIERVFLTEHLGESNYDKQRTFRISKGLIMIIREYTRMDFLAEMGL